MPSIGKDLAKIRNHLGLTLQDIQFETKLPLHTLEKIENDTIFQDAEEGPIYTRNFVRSYGRVLKIDDELLIEALNLREDEKYNHELLSNFPDLYKRYSDEAEGLPASPPDPEDPKNQNRKKGTKPDLTQRKDQSEDSDSKKVSTPKKEISDSDTGQIKAESPSDNAESPASSAESNGGISKPEKKSASYGKQSDDVDWADVGQKIVQERKQMPVWVIGLIILVIVMGIAGYFVFQSNIFSSSNSSQQDITVSTDETNENTLSIELDEQQQRLQPELTDETETSAEPPASALSDTLNIAIYAAFGNVDPVRVWSDTKPRFDPYWIEAGTAMTFDFMDSIQIRGPYDNMLVFMNGHLIENIVQNFYSDEDEYVELNRSDFTSDAKWSEITNLQVPEGVNPPQEIRSRPTFN